MSWVTINKVPYENEWWTCSVAASSSNLCKTTLEHRLSKPLTGNYPISLFFLFFREVESLCGQQKRNYSYACGLLSMLVRISTGRKGTGELAASKNSILISTSQLVIFAPEVVQCQALDALEHFLGVFSPDSVDVGRFMRNMLIVVSKVCWKLMLSILICSGDLPAGSRQDCSLCHYFCYEWLRQERPSLLENRQSNHSGNWTTDYATVSKTQVRTLFPNTS